LEILETNNAFLIHQRSYRRTDRQTYAISIPRFALQCITL